MKRVALALLAAFMFLEGKAAPISITLSNQSAWVAGHVVIPTNSVLDSHLVTVLTVNFSFDPQYTTHLYMHGGTWSGGQPLPNPGRGMFIECPGTNITLTLPENAPTNLPLALPAGYSVISCQSNLPATFEMMVGRPPDYGTKLYRLLTNAPIFPPEGDYVTNYSVYTFNGSNWFPEEPVANAGEALWVYQPPMMYAPHLDTNGFSFGALTGWGSTTEVLYSDSLQPANWQVLTNIPGGGGIGDVVDSIGVTTNRFYRLNMLEVAH